MAASKKQTLLMSAMLRAAGNAVALSPFGKGRVCIVNYHRVLERVDPLLESEPDVMTFRWQMQVLAESFNVMPLYEAVQALKTGTVPNRAVCITFDDGYRSSHDLALPVLREFGLPATVFVTTGFVGEGNMWNDRIIEAVRQLPGEELDLRDGGLGTHTVRSIDDKKRTINRLTADSKYLPSEMRLRLAARLEALSGATGQAPLMLTRDMVRTLSQQNVEIGAHTVSHPILTSLDDRQARDEIEGGKRELEAIIGKPVRLFAYPNGKVGKDFDARHVAMAQAAGFSAAFTTAVGAATGQQDCYQLPRCRPWDDTPFTYGLRLLRWLAC